MRETGMRNRRVLMTVVMKGLSAMMRLTHPRQSMRQLQI